MNLIVIWKILPYLFNILKFLQIFISDFSTLTQNLTNLLLNSAHHNGNVISVLLVCYIAS